MFAHDLCNNQIEYFSLRLSELQALELYEPEAGLEALRAGSGLGEECYLNKLKRQSEAIPQIFNRQYSIPACPGWYDAL